MCLLKRDDMENTCNHEDCKKFYQRCKQTNEKPGVGNEEQNMLDLLQKKIKKDPDAAGNISEREVQANSMNPMQGNQNFTVNPTLLTQLVQFPMRPELGIPNPPGLLYPLLTQQQNFQQGLNTQIQELNSSIGMPNILVNMRNQNFSAGTWQKNNMQRYNEENAIEARGESTTKEFQAKLYNLVLTQNKILAELTEKNNELQEALTALVGEVGRLKESLNQMGSDVHSNRLTASLQMIQNSSESVNTDLLLSYLYGPNHEFQYQLVLKQDLNLPLYRERNFKFTVMLVDKNGKCIENTNRIPLSLGIYSSENPPKYIDTNTAGNKILKGFIEKDLAYGSVAFEKIQIKEVTSHFRSGWVFFVVYPKLSTSANMITFDNNANFINSQKIKPLVLEKVVVKAKKTKEKDNSIENEDNDGDDEISN